MKLYALHVALFRRLLRLAARFAWKKAGPGNRKLFRIDFEGFDMERKAGNEAASATRITCVDSFSCKLGASYEKSRRHAKTRENH